MAKQNISPKKATELLEHLVNNNNKSVDEKAPVEFLKLAKILRAAPSEVMNSLWDQHRSFSQYR